MVRAVHYFDFRPVINGTPYKWRQWKVTDAVIEPHVFDATCTFPPKCELGDKGIQYIYVKVKAVLTSRGQYLPSARDMITIVSTQYLVANTF
jgi:hypothetical protein